MIGVGVGEGSGVGEGFSVGVGEGVSAVGVGGGVPSTQAARNNTDVRAVATIILRNLSLISTMNTSFCQSHTNPF
jgi:hypothetical protein